MSFEPVIRLQDVGKCYRIYEKPHERLWQMLWRGRRQYFREFWALQGVNLQVFPGEVVGIVGRNGSGKSTLLQLVCGTLACTSGEMMVKGRIATLLELGAGFNPDFTGRENIFLSSSVMGLSWQETKKCTDEIIEFSGVGDFIDQPVKFYSTGMYVRLAFSIAINVNPDILVIDEALSVGDGAFSHKSFERIMTMKEQGKTILFCSHSMYQVESLCNHALWLDNGRVKMFGSTAKVTGAYEKSLLESTPQKTVFEEEKPASSLSDFDHKGTATGQCGLAGKITGVELSVNGHDSVTSSRVNSGVDNIALEIKFIANPNIPVPKVAVCFSDMATGRILTSVGSHIDNVQIQCGADGEGQVQVSFPGFPMLKGDYSVDVYLLCGRGINVYDSVLTAAKLVVEQSHLEQGVVSIPRIWR